MGACWWDLDADPPLWMDRAERTLWTTDSGRRHPFSIGPSVGKHAATIEAQGSIMAQMKLLFCTSGGPEGISRRHVTGS